VGTDDGRDTRALVLHPDITSDPDRRSADYALDEAVALATALPSLDVVGSNIVRLQRPNTGMLFGKRKIADFADALIIRKSLYIADQAGEELASFYTFDRAALELSSAREPELVSVRKWCIFLSNAEIEILYFSKHCVYARMVQISERDV